MVMVALWVRLEAKPGKEAEVDGFLRGGLPLVQAEPATTVWFGLRLGPSTFGIFDAFPDEAGRNAHLSGRVAAALMEKASDLLAQPPTIEKIDVLAAREEWNSYSSDNRQPFLPENPEWVEDPLRFDCPSFRLFDDKGFTHVGFTPLSSRGRAMIQAGLPYYCTFWCIADECYHVYQDRSRGPEWRRDTHPEFVEEEAAAFADSLAVLIRRYLEPHGVFCK